MTDREAIEILQRIKSNCKAQSTIDIVEYSIQSLQEREERNKGCECCNGEKTDEFGKKVYSFTVQYYEIGDGKPNYVKAKYCPMCGKKLVEEKQHGTD